MILDGYWKSELHRYTLQLRFWSSLCRWTGSFAEHQVNKYLLYSAAIIRKLIEDEVDAKNEFQNSEYGIPELALLHYELLILNHSSFRQVEYIYLQYRQNNH